MFASTRRLVSQVLDLASRAVNALEGILEASLAQNRASIKYFQEIDAFRPLIAGVELLDDSVRKLAVAQQELGPAVERLEMLELSRVHFEAECEGMLLKADGKLKAASNAEARERQIKKSYERNLTDPFPPDGNGETPEGGTALLANNAQAGEAQRVPSMYVGMASTRKTLALRAKWGM